MDKPDDSHYIEKLEKELYSRDYKSPVESRSRLNQSNIDPDARNSWTRPPSSPHPERPKPLADSFLKKIFIFAVVFFVVCVGIAIAVFFWGLNTISSDKVDITFQGPISIAAGNELDFTVSVANTNNTALLNPVLDITFPDGTKEADDLTADYPRDEKDLGTINVNGTSQTPFRAVLFGPAQTNETIKAVVQYGIKGSNTVFSKETDYTVTISSAPVSITVTAPDNVIAGQNISLGVNVTSNSTAPLENLLFSAEYPFGFQFGTATPVAESGNDMWSIPTLAPGQQESFQISGTIAGQEGDQPTFHFNVGVASSTDPGTMGINYLTSEETIPIQQPALEASITFNGQSPSPVIVSQGQTVTGNVSITNNSSVQISDIQATAVFSGPLLDPSSPTSDQGFYQSSNNSIVWNPTNTPNLQALGPGQSTTLHFTFSSLNQSQVAAFTNGTMSVAVSANGQEATEGANSQIISNPVQGVAEIQSAATVTARVVYSTGPFKNTGPTPPQANVPTTYTVIWDISNGSDDLADAEVRATLPTYVTWVGAISPTTENITYDSLSNQVVWRPGDIPAGTGETKPIREVAFQISFLPSTSQLGTAPVLVNNATFQAVDTFTNQNVAGSAASVTTNLVSDPTVGQNGANVVQ